MADDLQWVLANPDAAIFKQLAAISQGGLQTSTTKKQATGGFDVNAAIRRAQELNGTAQAPQDVVPLWKYAPPTQKSTSSMDSWGRGFSNPRTSKPETYTADEASASWMDMSIEEKNEFKEQAVRAGILAPDADPSTVYRAWIGAVGDAADYNSTKGSWQQYISPWQALQKLQLQRTADDDGAYDAFAPKTTTQTQVQHFDEQDVEGVARQVLQQELQRDPTDAEVAAYTIAVNRAAKQNPSITESTVTPNENGDQSVETSTSGGIDPAQVIYDQIRDDPERAEVQAATQFYPAAISALNALVQL